MNHSSCITQAKSYFCCGCFKFSSKKKKNAKVYVAPKEKLPFEAASPSGENFKLAVREDFLSQLLRYNVKVSQTRLQMYQQTSCFAKENVPNEISFLPQRKKMKRGSLYNDVLDEDEPVFIADSSSASERPRNLSSFSHSSKNKIESKSRFSDTSQTKLSHRSSHSSSYKGKEFFKKIYEDPVLKKAAHRFCCRHHMPEVSLFLEAVLDYQHTCSLSSSEIDHYAGYLEIISEFIETGSNNEINICAKMRSTILQFSKNIETFLSGFPGCDERRYLFADAYLEIEHLFWLNVQTRRNDSLAKLLVSQFC